MNYWFISVPVGDNHEPLPFAGGSNKREAWKAFMSFMDKRPGYPEKKSLSFYKRDGFKPVLCNLAPSEGSAQHSPSMLNGVGLSLLIKT